MKAAANKLSEVGSGIEMVAARPGSLLVKPKTSVPTFHALAPLCEKLLLSRTSGVSGNGALFGSRVKKLSFSMLVHNPGTVVSTDK